jgi:hypothetical protein
MFYNSAEGAYYYFIFIPRAAWMRHDIFIYFQFFISHNVKGLRRFCGCDKGMRSIPVTAKMWRKKNAQRAQPDCVFL